MPISTSIATRNRLPALPKAASSSITFSMLSTQTIGSARLGKSDQPADLDRSHDLVGDQDVANARGGHHLGLAQLRARDADRAGGDLHPRNLRRLVRLRMRPPRDAMRAAGGDDPRDVGLHDVEIDQQRRGVQRKRGLADQVARRIVSQCPWRAPARVATTRAAGRRPNTHARRGAAFRDCRRGRSRTARRFRGNRRNAR